MRATPSRLLTPTAPAPVVRANGLDVDHVLRATVVSHGRLTRALRVDSRTPVPIGQRADFTPPPNLPPPIQPEPHVHLAVHRCRRGEVLLGLLRWSSPNVNASEADAAVSVLHGARLGRARGRR